MPFSVGASKGNQKKVTRQELAEGFQRSYQIPIVIIVDARLTETVDQFRAQVHAARHKTWITPAPSVHGHFDLLRIGFFGTRAKICPVCRVGAEKV